MLRLLAVITAAAARPEDATAYFDAAETLWPPTTAAGRCLAQQRKYGFHPKPKGSNFKTLGTEGVGHHKPWLARLRAYAAWTGRPADGSFDGVARVCARGSSDRACAAAWRTRAEVCAAALGRKHPTVVPRLLAMCA